MDMHRRTCGCRESGRQNKRRRNLVQNNQNTGVGAVRRATVHFCHTSRLLTCKGAQRGSGGGGIRRLQILPSTSNPVPIRLHLNKRPCPTPITPSFFLLPLPPPLFSPSCASTSALPSHSAPCCCCLQSQQQRRWTTLSGRRFANFSTQDPSYFILSRSAAVAAARAATLRSCTVHPSKS